MKATFFHHRAGKLKISMPALHCYTLILALIPVLTCPVLYGQAPFEETAPAKYRIEFTDKENSPYSADNPAEFLSQKAIERRNRQNIPIGWSDIPVNPSYIDSIRATGAVILTVSKWFNDVTILVGNDSILNKVAKLTFVRKYARAKPFMVIPRKTDAPGGVQEVTDEPVTDYGPSWWQTAVHNGQLLHERGFYGKNVTIAVIDAGFYHVDQLPAFDMLWEEGRILGTRDFVLPGAGVFNSQTHGMIVLSIIAGYLPGELIGTAPDANFWLLRSEDTHSEFLIEEDNWTAAAEFADSVGADIISSSLGYTTFDNPLQNHTYSDMDGNTTRISRAADIAASKGLVVVASAGNQGGSAWKYISAPADADSVLAVGAVDQNRYVAFFSSRGPSSDGDVKPDVMAIGMGTYYAGDTGGLQQGNGTSLSAPVITGLSACLWQANPEASAMQVIEAIRRSADRFTRPDVDYGYGIPDFNLADYLLRVSSGHAELTDKVTVFPNPFHDQLYIIFRQAVDDPVDISLFDLTGKEVARLNYPSFPGRNYLKFSWELNSLPRGLYIMKVLAGRLNGVTKLIKF